MPKTQGAKNRDKGRRMEYKLRDQLRSEGYKAHRVPASGAAQGFPGDIMFQTKDNKYLAELKSRAKGFEVLYEYISDFVNSGTIRNDSLDKVRVEYDLSPYGGTAILGFKADAVLGGAATIIGNSVPKVTRKLLAVERWAEKVDIVVLHTNRKPFLFIKYKGG